MEQALKKLTDMIGEENAKVYTEKLKDGFKNNAKSGDKKLINLEIKGGKEIPEGISFEFFSVKEDKYKEFIPEEKENMKGALSIFSASLKVKDAATIPAIQAAFEQMKPTIEEIPWMKKHKDKVTYELRIDGTKVAVDVVSKDEKIQGLIKEVGLKLSEFYSFTLALKSALKPGEVFNKSVEELCGDLFTCYFQLRGESTNLKYIIETVIAALEVVDLKKIKNDKAKKRIKKVKKYLKMAIAFVQASVVLEYDPKEVFQNILSKIMKDKDTDPAEQFETFKMMALGMGSEMIKPFFQGMGLMDLVKGIDVDELTISALNPEEKAGMAVALKLPGISQMFCEKFLA